MTVWRDGEWLDLAEAGVRADDRGFLLGDGLFETIRVTGGRAEHLPAHIQRLTAGAQALGLPLPAELGQLDAIVRELAERNALADAAVRLTLSAGRGLRGLERTDGAAVCTWLRASPLMRPPGDLALVTAPFARAPGSLAARHKTLSYVDNVAARRFARNQDAGMALMLDTAGHVSGADCANLFWMSRGKLFTPALDCAVLPGTARARVLAALPVSEVQAERAVLDRAEGAVVTNALLGAVAVAGIDGRALPAPQGLLAETVRLLAARHDD